MKKLLYQFYHWHVQRQPMHLIQVYCQAKYLRLSVAEISIQASANSTALLNSQSVVELSPSSSMKYPIQNKMFGSQLFKGAFASTAGSTFNSSYQINPGDNINLRLWGAYQFNGTQSVDPQGNIFIPNVGPVKVAGVRNGSLQSIG